MIRTNFQFECSNDNNILQGNKISAQFLCRGMCLFLCEDNNAMKEAGSPSNNHKTQGSNGDRGDQDDLNHDQNGHPREWWIFQKHF